jgi:hypothetical protein
MKLILAITAAALLTGCAVCDSLIFHPLHVVARDHKANEDAKWNQEHSWVNWPTNTP